MADNQQRRGQLCVFMRFREEPMALIVDIESMSYLVKETTKQDSRGMQLHLFLPKLDAQRGLHPGVWMKQQQLLLSKLTKC